MAGRYQLHGAAGLVSGHRGKRSNRAIAAATRREILELAQQRYADFPPTLAHEKLSEAHGYRLSVETLRGWLIEAGAWKPKGRRPARVHPPRERRPCLGELAPIDGSPHDWVGTPELHSKGGSLRLRQDHFARRGDATTPRYSPKPLESHHDHHSKADISNLG